MRRTRLHSRPRLLLAALVLHGFLASWLTELVLHARLPDGRHHSSSCEHVSEAELALASAAAPAEPAGFRSSPGERDPHDDSCPPCRLQSASAHTLEALFAQTTRVLGSVASLPEAPPRAKLRSPASLRGPPQA